MSAPLRESKLLAFRAAQIAVDDGAPGALDDLMAATSALDDDETCAKCGQRITDFADAMVRVKKGEMSKLMHSWCYADDFDSNVRSRGQRGLSL